ncbi:RNA-binding (RRM/RBD/RNP motifs) family protein [Actinidia rufa]|uniref:RNA-binding (RRM/RBD/RNP motifs) family protein n=1 Tax=Actinidia rufa TaxID=165716 RepID=A0A7J0FQE6_9ERIC|nr:RNA-binding (RRM/RBD/RNP motifs) family protein [Actinidia rufa]
MATKPNNNYNNAKSNGGSSSGPGSSTIFTILFGNIPEQKSSVSIFSDDNPFRRKFFDRSERPNQQQDQEKQQLGSGLGSPENPNFVEEKKRKRNKEKKPSSGSGSAGEKTRKSKRGEPKGSDFGEESEERGEGAMVIWVLIRRNCRSERKEKNTKDGYGREEEKKKKKRDEVEAEARHYGAVESNGEGGEGGLVGKVVGEKRKKVDDAVDLVVSKEDFDDEAKLLRTVFVGNLPLKVKKKAFLKEFSQFGEVESVRIRSVPLLDTKTPRKGAIIQKKINDAVDSVHAYIVFRTEEAAQASLAHNMAVVADCQFASVIAYSDLDTSSAIFCRMKKFISCFLVSKIWNPALRPLVLSEILVLVWGRALLISCLKQGVLQTWFAKKRSLKLLDRELRLCHAKLNLTPSKRGNPSPTERNYTPTKKLAVDSQTPDGNKVKTNAASSYQGLKGSKSGVQKKVHLRVMEPVKFKSRTLNGENPKEQSKKRPSVAARKANALKGGGVLLKTPEPIATNAQMRGGVGFNGSSRNIYWMKIQQSTPPLVDEFINVVETSDQWSAWRDTLATQMYNEWKTNRGMSKRAAKSSPRRCWTKREEEFLMGCMKELFNQDTKWKLDCEQFKGGFYGECEKKIICAFPGTDLRANPHIESKIKMWRKQYNLLQDMLKTSGFGWDDVEKILLVDMMMCGITMSRVTGDLAEGPADSVAAIETEEANKEQGPESPVLQFSVADMESISANWISKGLAQMADAFGIMFENTNNRMAEIAHRIGYAHDLSQQRRQVNAELSQLPLDSNQRLRAATMIVQDA